MESVDLAELTALAPLIQPGSREPILVKSHGQTVAAVLPVASAEDLEELVLCRSPQFEAVLQHSQRLVVEGGISPDESRRRLGLPTT